VVEQVRITEIHSWTVCWKVMFHNISKAVFGQVSGTDHWVSLR